MHLTLQDALRLITSKPPLLTSPRHSVPSHLSPALSVVSLEGFLPPCAAAQCTSVPELSYHPEHRTPEETSRTWRGLAHSPRTQQALPLASSPPSGQALQEP